MPLGGQRWVIKYRTQRWAVRSFSIPGRDPTLSRNARGGSPIGKKGKAPDPAHPAWQHLVGLVEALCVSKEGEALMPGRLTLDKFYAGYENKETAIA